MGELSKWIEKLKRWLKKQQQKYEQEQKPPVVVPDTPVPPNNPVIPNNLPLLCGTEFVEINDLATLEWMASCGLNYCRIHGSRIDLGGNNYERMWLMEWKDNKMRYNMDRVDPVFIGKLQRFVDRALNLGIYVCVSEPNSSESKGTYESWKTNPWYAKNNIHGYCHDDKNHDIRHELYSVGLVEGKPDRRMRLVLGQYYNALREYPNVIFQLGNEPDGGADLLGWALMCVKHIRNELKWNVPINFNINPSWDNGTIMALITIGFDIFEIHATSDADSMRSGSMLSTDTGKQLSRQQILKAADHALNYGIHFSAWHKDEPRPEWQETLKQLSKVFKEKMARSINRT